MVTVDPTDVKEEEVPKQLLEKYEELYKKLYGAVVARNFGEGQEGRIYALEEGGSCPH